MAQNSREEREIGSESREKGDLPPCSPLLTPVPLKRFMELLVIFVRDTCKGIADTLILGPFHLD